LVEAARPVTLAGVRASVIGLSLVLLTSACAGSSKYFVDAQSRFHIEMPPRMGVAEGANRVEAEHYDIEAKLRFDVLETSEPNLDSYIATLDPTLIESGDRSDTLVGQLPAVRLEFRGGIELGNGYGTVPNLLVYLIMDGATIYRLGCMAPDGPFESFCLDTFDSIIDTFGPGPAPAK
jgi:hypothetical protein